MKKTKAAPAGAGGTSKHAEVQLPDVTEQKGDLLIRAWITVLPSTVNGTELGDQEWRDALFLWHGLEPLDLSTHCDGCEARFTISNALDCKRGCLVTARHNELPDGVADLAGKAFTPAHVRDDPLIYSGRAMSRTKPKPAGSKLTTPPDATTAAPEVTEQKGDLLIRDLWQQGTDSVHDMRVVNTDALTHRTKDPEKCLHEAERGEIIFIWRIVSSSVSTSPPLSPRRTNCQGWKGTATLKRLASRLATNWKHSYSKTCGYVNSRITITLVRVTHRCIRGSRVPAHRISVKRPQW